jgi:hypothetical protein
VKVTMAVISWRSGTEFYRVLPRVSRCTDKIIGNDGRGGTLVSDPRSQVSRLRRAHLPVTRRCDGGRGLAAMLRYLYSTSPSRSFAGRSI